MSIFFDLFARSSTAPEPWVDPAWADRQFPEIVARSSFRLWHPGCSIPRKGQRILIGVATWSGYDMRLLDAIAHAIEEDREATAQVDVFNTADCEDARDFRKYVPTLHAPVETPFVGIWHDGELNWRGQGAEARDKAAQLFGLSSAKIVEHVQNWIASGPRARGA